MQLKSLIVREAGGVCVVVDAAGLTAVALSGSALGADEFLTLLCGAVFFWCINKVLIRIYRGRTTVA